MIHKLKRKFTILATVSMVALMTVLLLIMNGVNYTSVVKESDTVLDLLAKSSDTFREEKEPQYKKESTPFEIGMPRGMSPEVPYESRYFTVTVTENDFNSDLSKIISVDSDEAKDYAEQAMSQIGTRGFIGPFRYLKQNNGTKTKILFLDCGRKIDSFYTFLWISVGVGLFGCIIVFVAFLLVSGKIVKPISIAYEKQKQFISDAGHEIKTPLTIINANVDLLSCDGDAEELSEIRRQTKRLTELTNNLVFLSKMEESGNTVKKVLLPLSDIVGETANSFYAVANANGINYTLDIQHGVSVIGSPDSIRQLVSVLLDNAVKYSPVGGTVSVRLSAGKKTAVISVFNTTKSSVNVDDLSHVFDRFFRTDASRNSETGGHGIGLSIAKAITEMHGGTIYATTQSGMDFCVTVELPL